MTNILFNIEWPSKNNSARRMLAIVDSLERAATEFSDYEDSIKTLVLHEPPDTEKSERSICFATLMGEAYRNLVSDLKASADFDSQVIQLVHGGLEDLRRFVYPTSYQAPVKSLLDSTRVLLHMAAAALPNEEQLSKKDVDAIRKSIDKLADLIGKSDLPTALEDVLLKLNRLSAMAIDTYAFYGAEGFDDAIKRMMGELVSVYVSHGQGNLSDKSWWKAAWEHVVLFDQVIGNLRKVQPAIEQGVKVLNLLV